MTNYESLLLIAQHLPIPSGEDQRAVEWCDQDHVVALARHRDGGFEIFMRCPPLHPVSTFLQRHLEYDRWRAGDRSEFDANRLCLPAEPYYMPVATFLVEELLRNGASADPGHAFAASEPLIEMALRRAALEEETVLGLLGELRMLELLLRCARTPQQTATALESWRGYERASRDFSFGSNLALEIKVTRGPRSAHHISNISQVDTRRTAGSAPTEHLYLISIGLRPPSTPDNAQGMSLATQVNAVLGLLGPSQLAGSRNELQELFLARAARYGAGLRRGYIHDEMSSWAAYRTSWEIRFERAYDMNVDAMKVLRVADVEPREFVPPESVTFIVELPDSVDGDSNPKTDLAAFSSECFLQADPTSDHTQG